MTKFKVGDRVRRHHSDDCGVLIKIDIDEDSFWARCTVRYDDGTTGLVDEYRLTHENSPYYNRKKKLIALEQNLSTAVAALQGVVNIFSKYDFPDEYIEFYEIINKAKQALDKINKTEEK